MKLIVAILLLSLLSCNSEDKTESVNGWDFEYPNPGLPPVIHSKLNINYLGGSDSLDHFRGLFLEGDQFFISGTEGKLFAISDDILEDSLPDAKFTDLRDVHVLSDGSVIAMGIASPGKIWKKSPNETSFHEVYSNADSLVFMDGMDFWNDFVGLVYGDPLCGYHFILKTVDRGESWSRLDSNKLPLPLINEAGFAASGTGIQCVGNGVAYIGLGGDTARVLKTLDYGETWEVYQTPILSGKGGKGIYSLAFKDELNGVIVGGHWENPLCDSSKAFTNDGGLTWKVSNGVQEYRSCVTYLGENIYVSTGTSGTDITYDGGESWLFLDSTGFNSILFNTDSTGIAVVSYGKIARIQLVEK